MDPQLETVFKNAAAELYRAELVMWREAPELCSSFPPPERTEYIAETIRSALGGLSVPDTASGPFHASLLQLFPDPIGEIDWLSSTKRYDWRAQAEHGMVFAVLRDQLRRNRLAVSEGLLTKAALESGKRVWPRDFDGTPVEAARAYLKDTPFLDVVLARLRWAIPEAQRLEHAMMVAGSGHGKTQTLEAWILSDLEREDPPGMVVIDSKGDMVERLAHLDVFNPDNGRLRERLVVIDPRDAPHLNPFDIRLTPGESEGQATSRIIASMAYFFRALLGAELSSTMRVALIPFLHLMVRIPGATLQTLVEAINYPGAFKSTIETLPEAPRNYLLEEFSRIRAETKNAIKDRLYDLRMTSPAFDEMVSARDNCLDLPGALAAGKVVLINLDRDVLEKEPSAILGKWFISQTYRAALRRPMSERKPAYLFVDEAGAYFEEQTEDMLRTMRSYRVGAVLAFQDFGQVPASLRSAMLSNTSIKMVGGKSVEDARLLAPALRTTPEHILAHQKTDRSHSDFVCWIDGITKSSPMSLSVDHGAVSKAPAMSAKQYALMRANNKHDLTARDDEDRVSAPRLPPSDPDVADLHPA
jgi:hypothetical protein